jgi:hypothetical protein
LPLTQIGIGLTGAAVVGLVAGVQEAIAFLAGAGVVAAGYAVFGWRTAFRPPTAAAGRAFVRMIVGTALKWLTIAAGLALAMTGIGWPAGFVLGGALVALLAYVICISWLLR